MSVTVELSDAANRWLQIGEQGLSSQAIFTRMTGLNLLGQWGQWGAWTPSDPADLRRCRLLLEMVPEFAGRFDVMKAASAKWAIAVEYWDELCRIMDEEAPKWRDSYGWRASNTYKRMGEIGL